MDWPDWWEWEIELSHTILKRMVDRNFNEGDLRQMLEDATGFRPDVVEFRYVIETSWNKAKWEIIVEPDDESQQSIVVTAYPCD